MTRSDTIDLTGILKGYKDTWVALSRKYDKVIASAQTPKQALRKAKNKGYPKPLIFWTAKNFGGAIPTHV